MKFKKIMLIMFLLLTILTISAVSASEDISADTISEDVNDEVISEDITSDDELTTDDTDNNAIESNNENDIEASENEDVLSGHGSYDGYDYYAYIVGDTFNTDPEASSTIAQVEDEAYVNGTVTLSIDGKQYYSKTYYASEGYCNVYVYTSNIVLPPELISGIHTVTVNYLKFGAPAINATASQEFRFVPKFLFIDSMSIGETNYIRVIADSSATGTANLYRYDSFQDRYNLVDTKAISGGQAAFPIYGIYAGTLDYAICATVYGKNYTQEGLYISVKANSQEYSAAVTSRIYAGTNTTVDFKGPKMYGNVDIYVDGKLVKTVEYCGGKLTEKITLLSLGTHYITIHYDIDDDFYSKTFTVDVISRPGDNGTFTALQQKINDADAGSTIHLENNYTYDDGFSADGITISKPLIIDGIGHTINGNNKARIFNVGNSEVIFRDIVFINGENDDGAAIYGKCTAINCTFNHNSVLRYGSGGIGGAMCFGSAIDCVFNFNEGRYGGAMYQGSAMNCVFNSNEATTQGGAMCYGSAIDCIFNSNEAYGGSGGAMYQGDATNCQFTGNSAGNGGAMYEGDATNCQFTSNRANLVNYWEGNGGATFRTSATNSKFTSNYADKLGGAMYEGIANNCIFENNRAGSSGPDTYNTEIISNNNNNNNNNQPAKTSQATAKKSTKTTLTLKKVKIKKSSKKLVITATLKINKKAVKGKIIKFKFNKKTYKAKTNKKGVAKITIKKAVLKKLKVGKKITYSATYGKVTKKVTVKVKK